MIGIVTRSCTMSESKHGCFGTKIYHDRIVPPAFPVIGPASDAKPSIPWLKFCTYQLVTVTRHDVRYDDIPMPWANRSLGWWSLKFRASYIYGTMYTTRHCTRRTCLIQVIRPGSIISAGVQVHSVGFRERNYKARSWHGFQWTIRMKSSFGASATVEPGLAWVAV